MAVIRPFHGLRFDPEKAGDILTLTCPPYDIISPKQRERFLEVNPYNVIRLELPTGNNPYTGAGVTLREWLNDGILRPDPEACIYIYEEEFEFKGRRHHFKGMISRVQIEEFAKGVVLPHEETLSKAKTDRFNLMQATFCNFSPIYCLYMDESRVTSVLLDQLSSERPEIEITDSDGIIHRLWKVCNANAIQRLETQFEDRKLYIADGHHRYETSLNFRNWCREQGLAQPGDGVDFNMMMLVDIQNPGLVVMPTHRLLRGLDSFDLDTVLKKCETYFTVKKQTDLFSVGATLDKFYDEGKKAFAFYTGGDVWYLLVCKDLSAMDKYLPDSSAALRHLDVSVLHTLILENIFGIDKDNMASGKNLTYTKYINEAINSVRSGDFQCSFLLNPTRVEEIRDVAAAGDKMPQKSTYFFPKLLTGLVLNHLK